MRNPCIKLGDEVGDLIGFTADFFEYGTLWNALPAGIYINYIQPIKGKENEAIEQMLCRFEELKIRTMFIAPQNYIIEHLKKHNYYYYKDPSGTPKWVRLSEKGLSALCGRIGISEEEVIRQSQDYAV